MLHTPAPAAQAARRPSSPYSVPVLQLQCQASLSVLIQWNGASPESEVRPGLCSAFSNPESTVVLLSWLMWGTATLEMWETGLQRGCKACSKRHKGLLALVGCSLAKSLSLEPLQFLWPTNPHLLDAYLWKVSCLHLEPVNWSAQPFLLIHCSSSLKK